MTTQSKCEDSLAGDAEEAASTVARVGWIAKGLLFVVIGFLGVELARRSYRAEDADQRGALSLIADAPAGRLLVFVVGVGLLLFAAWAVWSAVDDDSRSPLGLAERVGRFGIGVAYLLTGVTGVEAAVTGRPDSGSGGGATSPQGLTARLFEIPGGVLVVAAIGVGAIAVAGYQLWRGRQDGPLDELETAELGSTRRRILTVLGWAGIVSRAAATALAGVLFVVAAWQADPDEAAGLDRTLRTLTEVPFGRVVLGVIALGLIAGGLFDIVTFRRRTIN